MRTRSLPFPKGAESLPIKRQRTDGPRPSWLATELAGSFETARMLKALRNAPRLRHWTVYSSRYEAMRCEPETLRPQKHTRRQSFHKAVCATFSKFPRAKFPSNRRLRSIECSPTGRSVLRNSCYEDDGEVGLILTSFDGTAAGTSFLL